MLGRTEPRTRDRMYCQTIRTVRDISRDDRARIATCSLRTLTDRLKENYSIDDQSALKCDSTLSQTIAMAIPSSIVQVLCNHPGYAEERLISAYHCMAFLGADAHSANTPMLFFKKYDTFHGLFCVLDASFRGPYCPDDMGA